MQCMQCMLYACMALACTFACMHAQGYVHVCASACSPRSHTQDAPGSVENFKTTPSKVGLLA
jgi:hypothetical protein